jgi:hypothetical protein
MRHGVMEKHLAQIGVSRYVLAHPPEQVTAVRSRTALDLAPEIVVCFDGWESRRHEAGVVGYDVEPIEVVFDFCRCFDNVSAVSDIKFQADHRLSWSPSCRCSSEYGSLRLGQVLSNPKSMNDAPA